MNWITLSEWKLQWIWHHLPTTPAPVGVVTCVWTQHKPQWHNKSRKLILRVRPANLPQQLPVDSAGNTQGKAANTGGGTKLKIAVGCSSWTHSGEEQRHFAARQKEFSIFNSSLGLSATNHSLARQGPAVPALPSLQWCNLAALSVLLKTALFPCWSRLITH